MIHWDGIRTSHVADDMRDGGQDGRSRQWRGPWDWELLTGPATITEGPAWDGTGLLYTSIENNEICCYDPATGDVVTVYRDTGGVEWSGVRSRRLTLRL